MVSDKEEKSIYSGQKISDISFNRIPTSGTKKNIHLFFQRTDILNINFISKKVVVGYNIVIQSLK